MPTPKEDPQIGFEDHDWGSKEALALVESMKANDAARKRYNDDAAKLKQLFNDYVVDAGLEEGTNVRIGGQWTTTVTVRRGGGFTVREWTSTGRGRITAIIE